MTDNDLTFHSRGGVKGSQGQRNADYAAGLQLLLRRAVDHGLAIQGAWVDSAVAQKLPLPDREILSPRDLPASAQEIFTLLSTRMKDIGRRPDAKPGGGNSTKRVRITLAENLTQQEVRDTLGAVSSDRDFRSEERLPAEMLRSVRADHVWRAVRKMLDNKSSGSYGPSTDYDLILEDGTRLSPKAVFGLAASEALGFDVLPKHFTGGKGTPCFEVLEAAGYPVVPKDASPATIYRHVTGVEGGQRLAKHRQRERDRGLPQAKRAAFMAEHGRLFCERCGLDPIETYGAEHGASCIEVHHARVQVAEMDANHISSLEDLQCLCANCHRIVHSELRADAE